MANLAAADVRFLSLFQPSIHNLRPAMRPLIYDLAAIRGELRYRQVLFDRSGQIVYQHALDADPLTETPFDGDDETVALAPAWSPDGTRLAFRRFAYAGGALCVMDADGSNVRALLETGRIADFLTWSPDGTRIALSRVESGNQDLVLVDARTGSIERITRDAARDYAPSWCRATGEIVFGSDRGGVPGVWRMEGPGGVATKISDDEMAGPPSISPDGRTVSWLDAAGRLVLLDRASGQRVTVAEPRGILAPASWNADGTVVAVAAYDWGSAQIYLIRIDDGRALRLTRGESGRSMPSWHPDGSRIAVVAGERNDVALAVLGGLQPYLGRLYEEEPLNAFRRGDDTRAEPPQAGR
jgi:Tol biopolymer transport system component